MLTNRDDFTAGYECCVRMCVLATAKKQTHNLHNQYGHMVLCATIMNSIKTKAMHKKWSHIEPNEKSFE